MDAGNGLLCCKSNPRNILFFFSYLMRNTQEYPRPTDEYLALTPNPFLRFPIDATRKKSATFFLPDFVCDYEWSYPGTSNAASVFICVVSA